MDRRLLLCSFLCLLLISCKVTNINENKAKTTPKTKMQELLEEQAKRDSADRIRRAVADSIYRVDSMAAEKRKLDGDNGMSLGLANRNGAQPEAQSVQEPKKDAPTIPVPLKAETGTYDLKCYSVVVGSFSNKGGADFWCKVLRKERYNAQIVQNEEGLYRVVILTTDDLKKAVAMSRKVVARFPGAWMLIKK